MRNCLDRIAPAVCSILYPFVHSLEVQVGPGRAQRQLGLMRFSGVLALAVIPIPHLLPLLQLLLPPPPNSHFPAILVFVAVLLGMGFI